MVPSKRRFHVSNDAVQTPYSHKTAKFDWFFSSDWHDWVKSKTKYANRNAKNLF